jgi:hypothetical protein
MCYEGAFAHRKRGRAPAHHSSRWPRGASAARLFDRRQLLQKVVAGSAKEDAHLIGKAGAQALLAGAPRRFKVSRAYERVERSRSAPRASIILRANCRVVHNRLKMLKLPTVCGGASERIGIIASGTVQ